jgi:ferrous iron transport protein B
MFQAVYSWAEAPMNWIDASAVWLQGAAASVLPDGPLEGLVVDGIIAGVGSVIIFLPQIIILFTFIILLEQCGYLPRAAFLLDRLMGRVGLSGAAFIPLLSSFACAIPGIMAARTIEDEKDRLTTILVAPLMTCSARLPVYALIIAAFIPPDRVGPGLSLQGLVMFGLYGAGVVSAVLVALILKLTAVKGPRLPLLAELPKYRRPLLRDLALGLWTRAGIFLKRAGTIIFTVTVALWALLNLPFGVEDPKDSVAGFIGQGLAVVLAPIGFDWEISLALVPGMAAREVVVGALGTIYAVGGAGEGGLAATLQAAWSLPTALSFLVWYIFAPQCLSTYAAAKRETNSWLWPTFMFAYLFVLAYGFAAITYWTTLAFVS